MVPRRLALFSGIENPLAAFGTVTGMVFPVLMFPSAILFSLAELLIPELARCAAVNSRQRIQYLIHRNLRITLLYGLVCSGLLFLLSENLCQWLYPGMGVSQYLLIFSLLIPMLYCDLIVDAMTKGLGQQRYCVRYNIISNSLDVIGLYFLLPVLGISGYYLSFLATHLLNFLLSLRRLAKIGPYRPNLAFTFMAMLAAGLSLFGASVFTGPIRRTGAFLGLFLSISYFFGVLDRTDLLWLKGLLKPQKSLPLS
jgi:stage V sporulation protein B